jgi:hypothetical protein
MAASSRETDLLTPKQLEMLTDLAKNPQGCALTRFEPWLFV